MSELNPQPLPPHEVTVHIPAEVYGNLEKFQKVEKSVFDLLGCGNCNSGFQIDWRHFREFVVTPGLDVQPVKQVGVRVG